MIIGVWNSKSDISILLISLIGKVLEGQEWTIICVRAIYYFFEGIIIDVSKFRKFTNITALKECSLWYTI